MAKIVTISLPEDLVEVWNSISQKSQWVQDQLRILSGIEKTEEHIKFHDLQNMCNPFFRITCNICYERFDSMHTYRNEWTKRTLFLSEKPGVDEYISERFMKGLKPQFPWHIEDGEEE